MAVDVVFRLPRPGDPRYPDGYKPVRVALNGDVVEVREGRPGRGRRSMPRQPFLFEVDEAERQRRLAELRERLGFTEGDHDPD